ncbi:MAG: alpha-amylase family protein [Bacteroidota bacterium]
MKKTFLLAFALVFQYSIVTGQWQLGIEEPMPSRQVHLDFHTSEFIPNIGEKFDKSQWQKALQLGKVNSINVFGKGHHGWSYYSTKVGNMHPELDRDLLGEQIAACHEIGINAPIYFTVGWSANDAEQHPEWVIRNRDGSFFAFNTDLNAPPDALRPHYSWKNLCSAVTSPYHRHIMEQVEEICKNYDVDGFWFDIYHIANGCHCQFCTERMKKEGVDLFDDDAVSKSMNLAFKDHMKALRDLVALYHPKATVYFNASTRLEDKHIFKQRLYDMNTHQDLEDLPTTWGGYDKLPLDAKYHLGQGVPITGMSGKFHKAWGEFGGFKHSDAIKYEAAAMISYGASCNFGDQLHPSGEMDMETYTNIGRAFDYVEKIEAYGPGGVPVSRLGLWLTLNEAADHGIVRMLLEMHYDFIVANLENLDGLELIVLPSSASLSVEEANKLNTWVKSGGKLITFGGGGLDEENDFVIDFGAAFESQSPFDFDFTVIENERIGDNLVSTPFLNYTSGHRFKPTTGKVYAYIREPYFNRTYTTYSSHRETPYKLENSAYPAVVKTKNTILFAHELDKLYYEHGVRLHRDFFKNAIDLLYEQPMLTVRNLPSSGRVSFLKQGQNNRYIAHLLYSPALLRGTVQVIEDFVPIPNVKIEVNVPQKISKVIQIPEMKELPFEQNNNKVMVDVATFSMHTGVVFEYN